MLPLGHIAGGYLITKALFNIIPNNFTQLEREKFSYWGAFFGLFPDIDIFYAFYQSAALTINHSVANHRLYFTHTPLVWLVIGILIYFFFKKKKQGIFGLVLLTGTWAHMVFDSIDYGVRWLWPFKNLPYAILSNGLKSEFLPLGFFNYWFGFLKYYSRTPTFYFEILIIILGLYIFWQSYKNLHKFNS